MSLSSQAFRNKGSRLRSLSKHRFSSIFRVSQYFGNSFPSPALLKRQNYSYHMSCWIKSIGVSVLSRSSDPPHSARLPPSVPPGLPAQRPRLTPGRRPPSLSSPSIGGAHPAPPLRPPATHAQTRPEPARSSSSSEAGRATLCCLEAVSRCGRAGTPTASPRRR
jgi:hypothetical protein